jgi:hypothetical protein
VRLFSRRAPAADEPKAGRQPPAEAFFHPDATARPLLVFQHLHKTAGTSFRHLARENLRDHEREAWPIPGGRPPPERLREAYAACWEALPPQRRATAAAVLSHSANFLLDVVDRPVRAVTIVREPVDRVLSRYHFSTRPKDGREPRSTFARRLAEWSLEDLYRAMDGGSEADAKDHWRLAEFFNGQARLLLAPHHDTAGLRFTAGPPPDADLWRERLGEVVARYDVGVSERFGELVDRIAGEYGWTRRDEPRKKANPDRPAVGALPGATREAIAAYNWLDAELYAATSARAPRPASRGT